jgi:hypothetical protein
VAEGVEAGAVAAPSGADLAAADRKAEEAVSPEPPESPASPADGDAEPEVPAR